MNCTIYLHDQSQNMNLHICQSAFSDNSFDSNLRWIDGDLMWRTFITEPLIFNNDRQYQWFNSPDDFILNAMTTICLMWKISLIIGNYGWQKRDQHTFVNKRMRSERLFRILKKQIFLVSFQRYEKQWSTTLFTTFIRCFDIWCFDILPQSSSSQLLVNWPLNEYKSVRFPAFLFRNR